MVDTNHDKPLAEARSANSVEAGTTQDVSSEVIRPNSWMYRQHRIGKYKLHWYASPVSQLVIVAFVCFLCPGMFNALTGVGGGGQVNANAADNANVALYSTFAVVGKSLHIFVVKQREADLSA